MTTGSSVALVSPDDQGATFVELFFDLVFVFAITQVTHYAAHYLDLETVVRAVIVFWLIWWGWTQFTWTLNAANTDHHHVRLGTLIATGIAFAMAFSVGNAFAEARDAALWFSLSYVGVRVLGLGLYYQVVRSNADHRSAVIAFSALSVGGLVAVLAGSVVEPSVRTWIWLGAIALDFGAARVAGDRRAWGLHPEHFAERHGLIVIIALGESLIVAGTALTSNTTAMVLATGAVAVLMTCLLWWTYFGWVREVLEEALVGANGRERARLGRDAYSLWQRESRAGQIGTRRVLALALPTGQRHHRARGGLRGGVPSARLQRDPGGHRRRNRPHAVFGSDRGCAVESRSLRALEPSARGGGNIGRLGTNHTLEPDSGAGHRMRGARHDCRRRTDNGSPAARASIALTLAGKRLVGDDSPSNEELSSCVDISTHCRPSVPS